RARARAAGLQHRAAVVERRGRPRIGARIVGVEAEPAQRAVAGRHVESDEVRVLGERALAENQRAGFAQLARDERIVGRNRAGQRDAAGGGRHVGGVDVVFQQHGNAIERLFPGAAMRVQRIELPRLVHRAAVDVNVGVDARTVVVERGNAVQVEPGQARDRDDVRLQRLLNLGDRRLEQLELDPAAFVVAAILGGERRQGRKKSGNAGAGHEQSLHGSVLREWKEFSAAHNPPAAGGGSRPNPRPRSRSVQAVDARRTTNSCGGARKVAAALRIRCTLHAMPERRPVSFRVRRRVAAMLISVAVVHLTAACRSTRVVQAPATVSADTFAVVDGRPITRDDVEKAYRRTRDTSQPLSDDETLTAKLALLNDLIVQDLLIAKARELKIELPDTELDAAYNDAKKNLDDQAFQQELGRRNLTAADMRDGLRRELLTQKVIDREVVSKITVTDQQVTDYFNANKSQFNIAEEAYHIA